MAYFIDIHLLPDPEVARNHLLSALYSKLHRALVQHARGDIGVAFPGHDGQHQSLGSCLRLLGSQEALSALMAREWLAGMRDHVRLTSAAPIPDDAAQLSLRRVQVKTSPERLRRRQMKRHGLTETQARERVPDSVGKTLRLPFVQLASASTGQNFRIYFRLDSANGAAPATEFNTYGLAQSGTVPCF